MSAQHSKVGFSSRKRWKHCPGSVRLSEGIESRSSKYAEEGTAAHALLEHCLLRDEHAIDWIGDTLHYFDHGVKKALLVEREMAEHIETVLMAIRIELATDDGAMLLAEQRLHLDSIHPDLFGTGDVGLWLPAHRTLQVWDLKYGAGVAVDVVDDEDTANEQLEGYGLGMLLKFPEWRPTHVELVIAQPRAYHADGPIRMHRLPVSYFVDLAQDLADEVRATEAPDAPLVPGDYCRWCPAAGICPKLKTAAQDTAKRVFAPGLPYEPAALAETLEWLPILEAWLRNVREFAYAEAEKGHVIPRHKLVEKRATRKWRDIDAAGAALLQIFPAEEFHEMYTEPELKSPAAIEKMLAKDQRSILDDLCVKESSGVALVHESDKRDAVKVDAKSAFKGT